MNANDIGQGIEAEVVWDGEWEHESDRVTPDQFLSKDGWGVGSTTKDTAGGLRSNSESGEPCKLVTSSYLVIIPT